MVVWQVFLLFFLGLAFTAEVGRTLRKEVKELRREKDAVYDRLMEEIDKLQDEIDLSKNIPTTRISL